MQMKKWYKIVSIISALAMFLSCFSGLAVVSAEDAAAAIPDFKALIEEKISVSNETTVDDINAVLSDIDADLADAGIEDIILQDQAVSFYKVKAIEGAYEKGSANGGSSYDGAPVNDEVLVAGVDGYIGLVLAYELGEEVYNAVVTLKIEAPMAEYTFASCSNTIDHWSGSNEAGWSYNGGTSYEKVVVPDEITKLNETFSWKSDGIRCIIYGKGLTSIPRMLSNRSVEVIGFKGALTTLPNNAFDGWGVDSNLKHIRIPETVTEIGSKLFMHSPKLTGLYLPEGLDKIHGSIVYHYDDADGGIHNWSEITIPSTVTYIATNAFAGAGSDCDVTILTKSDNLWNTNVFYNSAKPELGNKYSIRVFRSSHPGSADTNYAVASPTQKTYIDDTITIAEVAARVGRQASIEDDAIRADVNEALGDAETILTKVKGAFGNAEGYTVAYAGDWEVGLSSISNKIRISDGTLTTDIDIAIPFVYEGFDGTIPVTNATTISSLTAQLKEATGGDVEITDFYKIESTPEVIEVGSTYYGAVDGLVLIPGKAGNVTAYYNFTDENGAVSETSISLKIEPETVEKAYTSVTNDSQWEANEWGYYKYTGGWVDKVVIPDFVTGLQTHWYDWEQMKCVVYGKGTANSGQSAWYDNSLEVVVLSETVENINGWAFNGASNLKYIYMPNVKVIDDEAFKGCTSLEFINLPDTLTTIGRNAFAQYNEGNTAYRVHNLTEITVPASVTTIRDNAFNGAANACEITILGTPTDVNAKAFYNADLVESYPATNYQNNNVRIWRSIDSGVVTATAANKTYLDDTMGRAELTARAQIAIYDYAGKTYDSIEKVTADGEAMLAKVAASYGNPNWVASWKNDWSADKGFLFNNTIVIAKGDDTIELSFSAKKAGDFFLQNLIDEEGMTVDNNTTKAVLAEKLANLGLENYDIEILDFYKLNAYNGAVEVTANGKEVLVPYEDGYISAIVKVTGVNGESVTSKLFFTIDAVVEEYTFTSVSNSISDWEGSNSTGYKYIGSAQKVIIPDEITALQTHWFNWKQIKCVVYGKGTTYTGSCLWNGALEVVVMSDSVKTVSGWSFNSASNLKYVYMPESLETIDDEAFKGCTSLTTLKLPNSLKTIGRNAFAHVTQATNVHNLTQLEVPASVTNIRENAFNGAANPFEIILLGKGGGVSTTAFYNAANVEAYPNTNYQNNIVRVYKGSTTDSQVVTVDGNKLYIDDMTVAEAATRIARLASQLKTETYIGNDKLDTQIKNALLNSAITYEWANVEWTEEGANVTNTIVLSDGANTYDIGVTLLAPLGFYADGTAILDTAEWSANNHKQGIRFFNSYRSTATDKISVEGVEYAIKDFGILVKHIANDAATAGSSAMEDSEFVIGAAGVIKESGDASEIVRSEDTSKNQFSVYIKNIPQGGRDYWFQSRGYITYEAADGSEITVYTDSQITSAKAEYDAKSADAAYAGMEDWFVNQIG